MLTHPLLSVATRLIPLLAVLAAPLCASAQPTEYEVGASLVCDTQTQAERFVALFSGDAQAAVDAVNAEEHDPSACALINAAYLRGSHVGTARYGDNAFEIVRIWWSASPPPAFRPSSRSRISRCSASRNTRCKPVNENLSLRQKNERCPQPSRLHHDEFAVMQLEQDNHGGGRPC
jgi:hypothetical protein